MALISILSRDVYVDHNHCWKKLLILFWCVSCKYSFTEEPHVSAKHQQKSGNAGRGVVKWHQTSVALFMSNKKCESLFDEAENLFCSIITKM